ncbi:MAG: 2-oxo acid dehydrogenase subunit E2 [Promethearchaeota archaeon]|jgi:pyruvate/2-oxoglutarate dehydrogenase complex dihydrolipoamide acyltransferase (E2) component
MTSKKKKSLGSYEVVKFPKERKMVIDIMEQGMKKHYIKGLVEFDVTHGREQLKSYKLKHGKKLSFTGWFLKCIGQAASEYKEVHALKKGRKKIYRFDDVDISIMVEKIIKDKKIPLGVITRKINEKSVEEITQEIRDAQAETVEKDVLLGLKKEEKFKRIFTSLPKFIRKFTYWRFGRNPLLLKDFGGTISVTSVGMFGDLIGWGIPIGVQPLMFALGAITKKPGVIGEKIEVRKILHATILFDHDIIDGAPATRFLTKLKEYIESGFGLDQ